MQPCVFWLLHSHSYEDAAYQVVITEEGSESLTVVPGLWIALLKSQIVGRFINYSKLTFFALRDFFDVQLPFSHLSRGAVRSAPSGFGTQVRLS